MAKNPVPPKTGTAEPVALFRFSIVASLLAAPPPRGTLAGELDKLAASVWTHPVHGEPVQYGRSTIERWYYTAHASDSPTVALQRKPRSDLGESRVMTDALCAAIREQHALYPEFSYRCHHDNLAVVVKEQPALGPLPSYSTLRRWMKAQGLRPKPRQQGLRPGEIEAARRLAIQETRSYEVPHALGLWHADYHHASFRLAGADGEWITPKLLAFIDDYSRYVVHAQWFFEETAAAFVHGLCQALQKCGLPRALMIDNGKALNAAEVIAGLDRLGIVRANTRAYSPQQNGKIENFWSQVEGRLVPMMGDPTRLDEKTLNDLTLAWLHEDYHRRTHGETRVTPLQRLGENAVGRPCPDFDTLIREFRRRISRKQRLSDGTVSVDSVRFEVPSAFRHQERLHLRYAEWDLSEVEIVDPRNGTPLFQLKPLDKAANASGLRRTISEAPAPETGTRPVAPLLREAAQKQANSGLVPPWIPFHGKPRPA